MDSAETLKQEQNKKLTGAALIVMSSIILGKLTGFLRSVFIPNLLTQDQSSAFNMGFQITGIMYELLVGGAIAAAIIPVFSGYLSRNKETDGWRAVGTFMNIVMFISIIICIFCIIFANGIVKLIASGYTPEVAAKTVLVVRILFPSVIFMMMSGLMNGILNSYNKFAAAAYGPSIYNLGCALSIYFFSRHGIVAVSLGVLASSAIYFLCQFAFAMKHLRHFRFKIYIRHPGFLKLFKLAIPSLAASGISQINVTISNAFATYFPLGSVAALGLADQLWQMPFGLFAQSIGVAILPTISSKYATGDLPGFKYIFLNSMKTILAFTVPSMVIFFLLSKDIIHILKFSEIYDAAFMVSATRILMFFSFAIVTQSVVSLLFRTFYAINDTRTPMMISALSFILTILLNLLMYKLFRDVAGMAVAYTISSLVSALLLLQRLNRKLEGIFLRTMFIFALKTLTAGMVMGIVLNFLLIIIPQADSKILQLIHMITISAIGIVVYFMAAYAFRIDEISKLIRIMLRKVGGFLNRFQ